MNHVPLNRMHGSVGGFWNRYDHPMARTVVCDDRDAVSFCTDWPSTTLRASRPAFGGTYVTGL